MIAFLYMDMYMQCVYAFVRGVDMWMNVECGFENYIIRYRKSSLIIEL